MKIIAATHNKNKLRELREILSPLGFDVMSSAEAGFAGDVEETGTTFEENALIKARAIHAFCGGATLADDSGLEVDALGGEPGIYSARYGGEGLDDAGRTALLLKKLENVPDKDRTARFVCAIAYIAPDGRELTVRGTVEGVINHAPTGENGFGYDPVFYVPSLGKTFAQASSDEKNALSHRGRALAALAKRLAEKSEGNANA